MGMLDELFERHRGETVLVVSHSGVLTRILLTLAGASDEEYAAFRPLNASVTIIEFDLEKNHEVHLLSCCDHLEKRSEPSRTHGNDADAQRRDTDTAIRRSTLSGP